MTGTICKSLEHLVIDIKKEAAKMTAPVLTKII